MKKILLIFIGMLLISLITADIDLGIVKQGTCVELYQSCPTCTYCDIRAVKYPNGTVETMDITMTKTNTDFTYSFCNTSIFGVYTYTVYGNKGGLSYESSEEGSFEVTANGKTPAEGIVIVVFTILFIALMIFGIIYFIVSLGHVMQLDMDLLDTTIMISSYLGMWTFYYISSEYLGNAVINNLLEIAIDVGAVTHVFLPLVGFAVSFIMTNLKFKQKARITY